MKAYDRRKFGSFLFYMKFKKYVGDLIVKSRPMFYFIQVDDKVNNTRVKRYKNHNMLLRLFLLFVSIYHGKLISLILICI